MNVLLRNCIQVHPVLHTGAFIYGHLKLYLGNYLQQPLATLSLILFQKLKYNYYLVTIYSLSCGDLVRPLNILFD